MKLREMRLSMTVLAIFVAFGSISAQTRVSTAEKFMISAKAGGVNAVVGEVTVVGDSGRVNRVFKGDELQSGQQLSTAADGKVEILLNPGSYVRIGGNSKFQFDSTSLDDVRVNLLEGRAIFEVFGGEEFLVDVKAGTSHFALVDTGIYRVDATAGDDAQVSIHKGKVLPALDAKKSVGSGKRLAYDGVQYTSAKFDKGETDDLALWSKERAKQLSVIASSLRTDRLRVPLINAFYGGRWNLYNSFGLWVWDPMFGSHCFLPFGWGWSSPYGYGFGRPIWYYHLPRPIITAPPTTTNPGNNTTKTGDRSFADVVKTRDSVKRRDNSPTKFPEGEVFVKSPTRVRIEPPPVFDTNSTTKWPAPTVSAPVIVNSGNSPTKGRP